MPIAGGNGIGTLPVGGIGSLSTIVVTAAITSKPVGQGIVVSQTSAVIAATTPKPVGAGIGLFETQGVGATTTPVPLAAGVVATGNQATAMIVGTTPVPIGAGTGVGALPSQALYFVIDEGDMLVVAFGAAPQVNFVPL